LLTSTFLTLVVVPVMYSLLDRRKDKQLDALSTAENGHGPEAGQSRVIPAG
jgi:hypothetical protein